MQPYTVTLSVEDRANSEKVAILTYTNGERTVVDSFDIQGSIDNTFLADQAKKKIDYLNAQDQSVASIVPGPLNPKAIIPPPPPDPTPDELAKAQFLADVAILNKLKRAVDLEFIAPDAKSLADQKALVQSEFKVDYLDII